MPIGYFPKFCCSLAQSRSAECVPHPNSFAAYQRIPSPGNRGLDIPERRSQPLSALLSMTRCRMRWLVLRIGPFLAEQDRITKACFERLQCDPVGKAVRSRAPLASLVMINIVILAAAGIQTVPPANLKGPWRSRDANALLARLANSTVTHPEGALHPIRNVRSGQHIEAFPATLAEPTTLSGRFYFCNCPFGRNIGRKTWGNRLRMFAVLESLGEVRPQMPRQEGRRLLCLHVGVLHRVAV